MCLANLGRLIGIGKHTSPCESPCHQLMVQRKEVTGQRTLFYSEDIAVASLINQSRKAISFGLVEHASRYTM